MIVMFSDVYDAVRGIRQSINEMGLDLDNATHTESKGIITDELVVLTQNYLNLYNTDISMSIDLTTIRNQVDLCMGHLEIS